MHKALLPGAPLIHENGNKLSRSYTSRGSVDEARAKSAFIAQSEFETQWIEHGFMETEAAIAYPANDGLEMLSQGRASTMIASRSPNCWACRSKKCA